MRIITSSSLQETTWILVLWYICEVSQGNETILIWALSQIFPRVFFLKDLFDDYWMNVGLISAAEDSNKQAFLKDFQLIRRRNQ